MKCVRHCLVANYVEGAVERGERTHGDAARIEALGACVAIHYDQLAYNERCNKRALEVVCSGLAELDASRRNEER